MRPSFQPIVVAIALAASSQAASQNQFAVPWSVKKIVQAPPAAGRLVQVSGYLEKVGKDVLLRDSASGQKIDLDFSGSAVSPDSLLVAPGPVPVEVTARMTSSTNNGRRTVAVLGAIPLKP